MVCVCARLQRQYPAAVQVVVQVDYGLLTHMSIARPSRTLFCSALAKVSRSKQHTYIRRAVTYICRSTACLGKKGRFGGNTCTIYEPTKDSKHY